MPRSHIGWPIQDLRTCLLDRSLRLVPIGVSGEIFVGGPGLSRGYLGRPELTAERFIPDPWSSEGGARLYRSGDLARREPDGSLDFLGRIDHQVKIRGFRIELGEVEAALRACSGIAEAVVAVDATAASGPELHAWLVTAGTGTSAAALREELRTKIPRHMVPASFLFLDRFPLTPNGKIDRRALPRIEQLSGAECEFMAPRTATEEALAAIWAEVLGHEKVGVRDDFFALGGHSLVLARIASRIAATFFVELPLGDLFTFPTVESLAARIDEVTLMKADGGELDALLGFIGGSEEQEETES